MSTTDLFPALQQYVETRISEVDSIPQKRKLELNELTNYIGDKLARNQSVALNFICTHNSRRSHLTQIWATVAAHFLGVKNVHTFSGGTEATAFNPRAVAALQRVGFKAPQPPKGGRQTEQQFTFGESGHQVLNPEYLISFCEDVPPISCFSKKYDHPTNPSEKFAAIMTCSNADKDCPIVLGAEYRIAIKYRDPKEADDTPEESRIYDQRCAQIAREMLYVFQGIK